MTSKTHATDGTDKTDVPYVTYVINMDSAADRMTFMKTQLDDQGVPYTRVSAVQGSKLSTAEVRANATAMCDWTCTRSTLGCAMSHRGVWREVLRTGRAALVLEDDAVLCPAFRDRVEEALAACPADYDVLVLGCFFMCDVARKYPLGLRLMRPFVSRRNDTRTWTSGGTTVFVPERFAGTHAYIVSPQGAAALFKAIPRVGFHVDAQMNHPSVKLYAASPDLAFQRDMSASSIASFDFPTIISPLLQHKDRKGISLAYYLSSPAFRVGGLDINGWLLVGLVAGLGLPGAWWPYVAGYLLLETAAEAGGGHVGGALGPAAAYAVGFAARRRLFLSM